MYVTEQERIDSLTMRIERTDVKGSGFIQFPPQRPFQQPIEMQPPTMAHQAHPEFYRPALTNGYSAPRPAYQGGSTVVRPQAAGSGVRPQTAGSGIRPQAAGSAIRPHAGTGVIRPHTGGGARPQMVPASRPLAPQSAYTPPPTLPQPSYAARPAPGPVQSNGRDYVRPSSSGPSNHARPSGTYMRPPQPSANGHIRPVVSNAAARPQAQGRPPSRDVPSVSHGAPPGRVQAPAAASAAPAAPVARPAPVAAPAAVPGDTASESAKAEGGLSKSQLKRLRKKKREGAL